MIWNNLDTKQPLVIFEFIFAGLKLMNKVKLSSNLLLVKPQYNLLEQGQKKHSEYMIISIHFEIYFLYKVLEVVIIFQFIIGNTE